MPAESFQVDVNPAVLSWARESAGYNLPEVAERCRIPENAIAGWESGRPQPTWSDLRKLAKLYRRPVASLLLAVPPEEAPTPTDYRTLPDAKKELSPDTRFAIRTARWLLRRARELEAQLGVEQPSQAAAVRLSDDPDDVARDLRRRVGVTVSEQTRWGSIGEALARWRAAVEAQRVFVFQFRAPVKELRGFSHVEEGCPAIALNQKDAISARIFTLFHEYTHLLIARPGMCLPEEGQFRESKPLEKFCNGVAGSVLIPRADFEPRLPPSPTDEAIAELAQHYRVSRYVVLGRMRTLGAVSTEAYRQITGRWETQRAGGPGPKRRQKGGPSRTTRCLNERGRLFVSVVLEAAKRDVIPASDATSYLGIRLKDYPALASKVK